jgi:hypothetical protein
MKRLDTGVLDSWSAGGRALVAGRTSAGVA